MSFNIPCSAYIALLYNLTKLTNKMAFSGLIAERIAVMEMFTVFMTY